MNELTKDSDRFAETAGEYLAGETDDPTRLLSYLESNRRYRRAFFKALEADTSLDGLGRDSRAEKPATRRGYSILFRIAAVLMVGVGVAAMILYSFHRNPPARLIAGFNQCKVESTENFRLKSMFGNKQLVVKTSALSMCDLLLSEGSRAHVRLQADAGLRIHRLNGGYSLHLLAGRLLLDAPPGSKSGPITIFSGESRVVITGTRVIVERRKDETIVQLLKGSVRVDTKDPDANLSHKLWKPIARISAGEHLRLPPHRIIHRPLSVGEKGRLETSFASMERVTTAKDPRAAGVLLYTAVERARISASHAKLRLKDGRVFIGLVRQKGNVYIIVTRTGHRMTFSRAMVAGIDLLKTNP